ncbi:MAG: hypothetical protein H6907_08550 [Hyphomicrobiales bacterium]|nr:hypothetical protein [Hyphomicrobiales bacterium]
MVGDGGGHGRLAAILAADMVGYTTRMEADTDGTVAAWKDARTRHIDPTIAGHGGRIVKHTGDGFLAEFPAVRDAVACALALQESLAAGPLRFRMGIHLGDVIDDGEDIHGEGVNLAARLEPLAEPGGIAVSGGVFEQVRNRLDCAFEDMGSHRVKHVSAPVRVYAVRPAGAAARPRRRRAPVLALAILAILAVLAAGGWWWWGPRTDFQPVDRARLAYQLPGKPSIAVLPFRNISGAGDQDFLAVGFSEDILTSLSKLSGLFVISGSTSLKLTGDEYTATRVAEDLGVRYVLSGSLQRDGNRIRVSARLVDAIDGRNLWSDRFDRELTDLFAVKDEITLAIISNVGAQLELGERDRVRGRETHSLDAWLLQREGYRAVQKFNAQDNAVGRRLLERAVEIDPGFATAYANLGLSYRLDAQMGWVEDRKAAAAKSLALFRKALEIDPDHGPAMAAFASWHLARGEVKTAIEIARKAVPLEPSDYFVHAVYGWALIKPDTAAQAVAELRLARRLSPRAPDWVFYKLAEAHLVAGDAAAAAKVTGELLDRPPSSPQNENLTRLIRALALAKRGETEAARREVKAALAAFPQRTLAAWTRQRPYADPGIQADWSATLRDLGMP